MAPITPADNVREILARHPETAAVFERHGLTGCGGSAGPDERLDLFAAVHRVDVTKLIAELSAAVGGPAAAAASATPDPAARLWRRFVWAALISTLTLGATFGAYNLLVIHLALGTLPPEHNWAHASSQLFGFVLLFLMGVAYHALPRFLGTPIFSLPAARASFLLALAGLLARVYGQFGAFLPGTAPCLAAGSALLLAAIAVFAAVLAATWRASRAKLEPFHAFLAAGLAGWLAAAGLLVAEGVAALSAKSSSAAAPFHEALYACALFGGILPFIEGMLLRAGPVFLGLREPSRRAAYMTLALGAAGAALTAAGALRLDRTLDAGLLLLAAATAAFLAVTRAFTSQPQEAGDRDRALARILRQAFFWLAVFALLATGYAVAELSGLTPSNLIFDGLRHAFALGFVTLAIFGMAGRILPVFAGVPLRRPALLSSGAVLVSLGLALRELEVVAALGAPSLLSISAFSGLVAATGVTLAATSILATLRAPEEVADAPREEAEIGPGANVHALLAAHPEALAVLVGAGFTQLANPAARATFARLVTLGQACRMHGRDAEALTTQLRDACAREHLAPAPEPTRAPAPELPLSSLSRPVTRESVLDVLRHVFDPELGVNVVDLGLIYDVDVRDDRAVRVRMTLTSPHCPAGQYLAAEVDEYVRALPGAGEVAVELTFEPPWSPQRMAPEARTALGLA